jgi:hypothetical protein
VTGTCTVVDVDVGDVEGDVWSVGVTTLLLVCWVVGAGPTLVLVVEVVAAVEGVFALVVLFWVVDRVVGRFELIL